MTLRILYSLNKTGIELDGWMREIAAASNERYVFIPFNHEPYINPKRYIRAQLLDNVYYERDSGLMRMYEELRTTLREQRIDALLVDNALPYHPEFLRTLDVYKVMRTSDGPLTAYDRDFAYLHAYQQVLYHSPAYSRDMGMAQKLRYCGADNIDFWPFALFDYAFDPADTDETILAGERDIDVIFIGFPYFNKMPLLAKVKKALGRRCHMIGFPAKHNAYFNAKYGFPGYVHRPIRPGPDFIRFYHRAKIGFNVHNRGGYTVGSFRLFDLPGNGVMQISDGGEYLSSFFEVGREIESYRGADELIDKIRYYLEHDAERERIALGGFRRVLRDYRIKTQLHRCGALIENGMARCGWLRSAAGESE